MNHVGSNPDSREPDDPDDDDSDNDNNVSNPSVEDNPHLVLTNTISCLSHATRHRPKDSGAVCTKVHEPNTFDSMDLKKLHEFLVQCKLNFHDRPQTFCLDSQKVGFALSFLKGITLTWFEADLNSIPGAESAWADDYLEFIIELTINFGPHDPRIDTHYWECKSEIAHQAKTNSQSSSLSKQSSSGGSSSKQSNPSSGTFSSSSAEKGKNLQHSSSSTPKSSNSSMPDLSGVLGKDGKLIAMECLCHIKNLLCLFCGLPGHSAKDCPRSMSHAAKACAAQAASITASTAKTPAEAKK
ncbi:hypothetical protein ID866_8868 [Astraeus odoratus]|nr:hypothetical protein ID866_8868 [Astraeus odoratus]